MEIFVTDYWALTRGWQEHDALATRLVNVLQRAGVRDHMPFILEADGSYDVRLNQFFRELPTHGVRSPRSWRSYALDILTWSRFLADCHQKTIWDATHADFVSFHAARRGATLSHGDLVVSSSATAQIDASSWNRYIAALDKFYRWAFTQHYIHEIPFTYRQGKSFYGGFMVTTQRNDAKERGARHGDMRFLSLEDYVCFREVGLRGRLPDGRDDPTFRGRNGARNVAFAELLVTTGMRLTEANSLLLLELPRYASIDTKKNYPFSLAPAITKGEKRRTIRLPKRILKLIQSYQEIERSRAIDLAQQKGTYRHLSRWIGVQAISRRTCQVQEGSRTGSAKVSHLSPTTRGFLYRSDEKGTPSEPLALWLNEQGLPIQTDSWEAIFAQASARCQRFGFDLEVTPHMLRHTFAVHMLAKLIEVQIGKLFASRQEGDETAFDPATAGIAAYRRLAGDPLRTLQRLLGHASITSTMIYLTNVMEAQELVDQAIERYAASMDILLGEARA